MKTGKFALVALIILIVFGGALYYVIRPEEAAPGLSELRNPKTLMSSGFAPRSSDILPSSSQYDLPLDPSSISNWDHVIHALGVSREAQEKLKLNGFVVLPWGVHDDFIDSYESISQRNLPVYVTVDSMLHLYHVQFDDLLSEIEETTLFPDIFSLTECLLRESEEQYSQFSEDLREAAKRNSAFFAVALALLDPGCTSPSQVLDLVESELSLIEEHAGFSRSPIFHYDEDYSQYVPRGHYTKSETLKRYFKAMMWYGRIAFLIKGGPDALISQEDAKLATIQASLIATSMGRVRTENQTAASLWNKIYAVTAFFVGVADDLTPYEYVEAIEEVFGLDFKADDLIGDELDEFRQILLGMRAPTIYSGTGNCNVFSLSPEELTECLEKSMGMRFMGQRYVPDSYAFQYLVAPSIGLHTGSGHPFTLGITALGPTRVFPRGLDFMAVMGSDRALDILGEVGDSEYQHYEERMADLREEFGVMDEAGWGRNLYWIWLHTLKAMIEPRGSGYPSYMQTNAWLDRQLYAAVASWAELRHDTILYAKQSYTPMLAMAPTQEAEGYVEPLPDVYLRLSSLVETTEKGLTQFGLLKDEQRARLNALNEILELLADISEKELIGEELNEQEGTFIRSISDSLEYVVKGMDVRTKSTILVADVHTDANSDSVLEEGIGKLDMILVVFPNSDGSLAMAAGPTLSYYEFKQPMEDRLTDEAWKDLLTDNPPDRPGWIASFAVEG